MRARGADGRFYSAEPEPETPAPREVWQLTIDGREVPAFGDEPTNPSAPLSRAQRAIIDRLRVEGAITPLEAGRLLHAVREQSCDATAYAGEGCCRYCSSDGAQAMRRLAQRGLVHRPVVGLWEPIGRPA